MNISYQYSSITDLSIKHVTTGTLNKLRTKMDAKKKIKKSKKKKKMEVRGKSGRVTNVVDS